MRRWCGCGWVAARPARPAGVRAGPSRPASADWLLGCHSSPYWPTRVRDRQSPVRLARSHPLAVPTPGYPSRHPIAVLTPRGGTMDSPAGTDSGTREKAQEVAGQAQEKVQEAAGEARNRVREQVDQRSTDAAKRVQATAGDIRSVGDELRKQGKDQPAKLDRKSVV